MVKQFLGLLACGAALAGCSAEVSNPQVTRMLQAKPTQALVVPEGVSCIEPAPERNAWIRDETPPLSDVIAAYHRRGFATQESRVYRSYKAWHDADQDHVKAAQFYGPGYVAAAACWS